jgi:hypothetical protein
MRLIDADTLKEKILNIDVVHCTFGEKAFLIGHKELIAIIDNALDKAIDIINNAPTIQGRKIIGYEDTKGEL